MKMIPQPHGGSIVKLEKGESGNLNGRPKKIYSVLKESGYSKEDIKAAFEEIGWQTSDDLDAILDDSTKPMILRLIAKAFQKGTEKGDFRYVSEILAHVIGRPKENGSTPNVTNYNLTLNL